MPNKEDITVGEMRRMLSESIEKSEGKKDGDMPDAFLDEVMPFSGTVVIQKDNKKFKAKFSEDYKVEDKSKWVEVREELVPVGKAEKKDSKDAKFMKKVMNEEPDKDEDEES